MSTESDRLLSAIDVLKRDPNVKTYLDNLEKKASIIVNGMLATADTNTLFTLKGQLTSIKAIIKELSHE